MASKVTQSSEVVTAPQMVSADLAGEAAILNNKSGVYFGLNDVGARIWQLIATPTPVSAVKATLLEEYDVDPAQCERDLLSLLENMAEHGLIEVR